MYYTAKVKFEYEDAKGNVKKKSETYLVAAHSVTEAEAVVNEKFKTYPMEFEVKAVSESRIIDVY
jgi:hypothetical protein